MNVGDLNSLLTFLCIWEYIYTGIYLYAHILTDIQKNIAKKDALILHWFKIFTVSVKMIVLKWQKIVSINIAL